MTSLKEHAGVYRRLGLHLMWGSITDNGEKKPNWYSGAPAEPGPRDMLGHFPSAALRPLLVVDPDSPAAAKAWWEGPYKTPFVVRTGKGGHFYYRAPEGFTQELACWDVPGHPETEVLWKQWTALPPSPHPFNPLGYGLVGDWGPHTGVMGTLDMLPVAPAVILTPPRRALDDGDSGTQASGERMAKWVYAAGVSRRPVYEVALDDIDQITLRTFPANSEKHDLALFIYCKAIQLCMVAKPPWISPDKLPILQHAMEQAWQVRLADPASPKNTPTWVEDKLRYVLGSYYPGAGHKPYR